MSKSQELRTKLQKLTGGEKCLLIHILATLIGVLILIIIYLLHLLFIRHTLKTAFFMGYNKTDSANLTILSYDKHYIPLGVVFLNRFDPKPLCNSLLLRGEWSLVPGHCAAMRSDPEFFEELPYWRVRYMFKNSKVKVTAKVKRSVPHPHFNRDNFDSNIGLLEHDVSVFSYRFVPSAMNVRMPEEPTAQKRSIQVLGWDWNHMRHGVSVKFAKSPIRACFDSVNLISTGLRSYEFCVTHMGDTFSCFDHGALVFMNRKIVGLFSWGEKCLNTDASPFVIIEISAFKDWFEDIIKSQDIKNSTHF